MGLAMGGPQPNGWLPRSQLPPLLGNAPAGTEAEYPNHSGTNGALGSQRHNELYPRAQVRPVGRHQPS
jgi:hypothetical protein